MSETPSSARDAGKPANNASKYLFMLLLGLVVGIIATVMVVRALDARADKFHGAVMHVQAWHFGQLKRNVELNRCGATDTLPHIRTLREMANDLEPAFPDLREDERFVKAASGMRATLDGALASPPLNCAGVDKLAQDIGSGCKACHQDFRG